MTNHKLKLTKRLFYYERILIENGEPFRRLYKSIFINAGVSEFVT